MGEAARTFDAFSEDELRTINRVTGLSTDYFNHHNEAVMLLDLIADMPEVVEDLAAWRPVSYREHFETSSLGIAEAAIAGYEAAPADIRAVFDEAVTVLDAFLSDAIRLVIDLVDSGDMAAAGAVGAEASKFARRVIAHASALVNGSRPDVFAERRAAEQTEALINALF